MWLGEQDFVDYQGKQFLKMRDMVVAHGWKRCPRRSAYWIGNPQDMPDDDNIYRVNIDPDTGYIKVTCIGLEKVDAILEGNYDDMTALPDWMQEKLTLLSMLSPTPPTEPVAGVGRRINGDTYWVFC
jgi:hypothetical protein